MRFANKALVEKVKSEERSTLKVSGRVQCHKLNPFIHIFDIDELLMSHQLDVKSHKHILFLVKIFMNEGDPRNLQEAVFRGKEFDKEKVI